MFQGICPECNSADLNYSNRVFPEAEWMGYEWKCMNCQAEGVELYITRFVEHEIQKKGTTNGNV
jgi:hypothetical protein